MQAVCGPFCAIQITAKKNAQVKKAAVALDKKETKQKLIKLKTMFVIIHNYFLIFIIYVINDFIIC